MVDVYARAPNERTNERTGGWAEEKQGIARNHRAPAANRSFDRSVMTSRKSFVYICSVFIFLCSNVK